MRCAEGQAVAHRVELNLLFDGKYEFARNFIAEKCPINLTFTEARDALLINGDEIGLLIAEVESVFESKTRGATLTVEKRELWCAHQK